MNIDIEEIELGSENQFKLPTAKAQAVYKSGIERGRLTLNQVRAHQGLPPLPYGDSLRTVAPIKLPVRYSGCSA